MTVQHKDLTGADLHEPKGVSGATTGQVYVANGAGSGTWQNPLSTIKNLNAIVRDVHIADIGVANANTFVTVHAPSTLTKIRATVDTALTTADAVFSLYRNGVLLGQSFTIPFSGSGAGVVTTLTLSPSYVFTAGQTLEIRSDGGPANSPKVWFSLEFTAN